MATVDEIAVVCTEAIGRPATGFLMGVLLGLLVVYMLLED